MSHQLIRRRQIRKKDGIRVSVVPYQFNAKTVAYREYRDVPTLFVVKNQYRGETRQIPSVQIDPGNLRFKVRINNRLERVLRLAGAVVAYEVAGRTENVASANYQEFLNGIILPRQEAEFDLGGPALSVLKDQTTMGLFIYDVVTATDAAGNPTQRSNFEWYFTVRMEPRTQQADSSVKEITIDENGLKLLRQRGIASGQWARVPEWDPTMERLGL